MTGGWDGLLEEGEHILWQGQPVPGIDWSQLFGPQTIVGAVFTGFSMFWMAASAMMISTGDTPFPFNLFPLFGLPFLLIGLFMLFGHVLLDAYVRRGTWYSVSTRQFFIARNIYGRKRLEAVRIANVSEVKLLDETPGSVIVEVERPLGFHTSQRPGRGVGGMATERQTYRLARIAEARQVWQMLRDQQRGLQDAARRAAREDER